jgi:hypothetical protein
MNRISVLATAAVTLILTTQTASAQIGELRVNAGLANGLGSNGLPLNPVTTASFSFVKSSFSLGPEVLYVFGTARVFGLGAVARLRVGSGPLRPYLIGGLGGNWHRQDFLTPGLFSGSLGAGVSLSRAAPMELTLEARLHKNLQRYGGGGDWDFITVAAGVRFGW